MADNNYDIAVVFPIGLLLNRLIQEIPTVWPADLLPALYTQDGRPFVTVVAGNLLIETPRALAGTENADALALFLLHDPTLGLFRGITLLTRPAPEVGGLHYVRDGPKQGGGLGALEYSDGLVWRQLSNDAIVA